MNKEFDKWNNIKKHIDKNNQHRFYHEREIWWCNLGINIGFEQDGRGSSGERPVLVLKGFSKQTCLIVPLTTSKKKNAYNKKLGVIDSRDAAAIISQIRLIDTKRLINKVTTLDKDIFNSIRKTIKDIL